MPSLLGATAEMVGTRVERRERRARSGDVEDHMAESLKMDEGGGVEWSGSWRGELQREGGSAEGCVREDAVGVSN